ncbi:glycoside hydrolase family 9 protein [Chamaesiphon sp. VAR_48_metabat_135_sub]|uniref:glycoside hydrolase family 9 protein n=1 Tax=Chamaesiphon sp. VAR_48_metabat_135_sub TaxID=2964699 RepID=UPI00286CF80E|nr:glycoside hydrolase family 9 protein [Chamaesiphon sp. VAR_48_metabat_135_sub]
MMNRSHRLIITLIAAFFLVITAGNFARLQAAPSAKIVVNQVGYLPNSPKVALLVNSDTAQQKIELVDSSTKKTVQVITPTQSVRDRDSNDRLQTIDFSQIEQTGNYFLRAGSIESYPFSIASNVYQEPIIKLLRSYYLQRCGVAIDDPVTGIRHAPCHLRDGSLAHQDPTDLSGKAIPSTGGWHDAGDYGKYVSTTAVTVGRLLSLYENNPKAFPDRQLTIPESGNGISDLLDEMRVGLDWMRSMQRSDGAVYRKLSGKKWPSIVAPDEDTQPRFIYGISTAETAKFAAAMAIAARVYAPFQPQQSTLYLKAARRAWDYLQMQSAMKVDWVNGDDSGSGKYLASEIDTEPSLKIDTDDRLWAAAELFITTKESQFDRYFLQQLPNFDYSLFEWKDPTALGMLNYLSESQTPQANQLKLKLAEKILHRADALVKKVTTNGYHLANHRFIWGSNKMTATEGLTLILAYRLTDGTAYRQAAIDQIDYLLGRNPFNQTFVTGIGTHPVRHVNHIFARARKISIPGLLVGGANSGAQDGIAPKNRGLLSYVDDEKSYATNEYAIDYNAELIALMSTIANQ